jgi:N-acylglucosamine-6-phosphate 2-epimerase/N-acetylmuramic acid 6-phosphate etherase
VLVRRIREELKAEVFADISTFEEGVAAADWGATYLATTLSGYTEATQPKPEHPDLELLEKLAKQVSVPVVAEGRYNTPEWVKRGFDAGAHAVVVGTMITNPREITKMFVRGGVPA